MSTIVFSIVRKVPRPWCRAVVPLIAPLWSRRMPAILKGLCVGARTHATPPPVRSLFPQLLSSIYNHQYLLVLHVVR